MLAGLSFEFAFGQNKHTFTLNRGNYAFSNGIWYQDLSFAQTGLQYEYHMSPKWSAFLGLSGTWKVFDVFSRKLVKNRDHAGYLAEV